VASASGGHLATIGSVEGAPLFAPGDFAAAAASLRNLLGDAARMRLSVAGRARVSERFTLDRHVDRLVRLYEAALAVSPPETRVLATGGS
jgi:glycosyltransferase involved in cell wall biosynthesis